MERLRLANRLIWYGNTLAYVRYIDDFPAYPITNGWDDTTIGYGETKEYVVQTSTRVVERCLLLSTDPGDLVVDPDAKVAKRHDRLISPSWGRRWITIDTSRVAIALPEPASCRPALYYLLLDSEGQRSKAAEYSGPSPGEDRGDIRKGSSIGTYQPRNPQKHHEQP